MNILIADKLEPAARDRLVTLGCRLDERPELSPDELPEALAAADPEGLIVRSTKVTEQAIAAAPRLQLVIRAGAGTDTIDVDAASRAGVFVANCPGKNAAAVAELAWGLILACDRQIPDQVAELRAGSWQKSRFAGAPGLKEGVLGLVGLGTIGQEVARRGRAFGMRVVAWSRSLTSERASELGVERAGSPLELAERSDVISVHVASNAETAKLIDAAFLERVKPGAILVNTSRGAVVDEAALLEALETRELRVGLDVYDGEPKSGSGSFESKLAAHPRVYGTHHVGASTRQAQVAIALEAARIVEVFRDTGVPPNCVNRARKSSATSLLTVRHHNQPGVLAGIFRVLGEAGINVEEMDNILYEGAHAACAHIQLTRPPDSEQMDALRGSSPHILSLELTHIEPKR